MTLAWSRLALTAAQVEEHVPPGMQITDRNGRPKIEVEALPVEILLRDVRAAPDALLPEPFFTAGEVAVAANVSVRSGESRMR